MNENEKKILYRCPVCCGSGLVPAGFYLVPVGHSFVTTSASPEQCRSCGGYGIVQSDANANKTN